jgi:hypothetical protein
MSHERWRSGTMHSGEGGRPGRDCDERRAERHTNKRAGGRGFEDGWPYGGREKRSGPVRVLRDCPISGTGGAVLMGGASRDKVEPFDGGRACTAHGQACVAKRQVQLSDSSHAADIVSRGRVRGACGTQKAGVRRQAAQIGAMRPGYASNGGVPPVSRGALQRCGLRARGGDRARRRQPRRVGGGSGSRALRRRGASSGATWSAGWSAGRR